MPRRFPEIGEAFASFLLLPACGEKVAGRPDEGQRRDTP